MKKHVAHLAVFVTLLSSCGQQDSDARKSAVEVALKPFEEIQIATGSRLNIGPDALPMYRALERAGLIKLAELPQGYWDGFATRTFMEGAKSFRVSATQQLNTIALNPRDVAQTGDGGLNQATIAKELEAYWNASAKISLCYKVEGVTNNVPIAAGGDYRLVEGTYVYDFKPEFRDPSNPSAHAGSYVKDKYRAIFKRSPHESQAWAIAPAADNKYFAVDRVGWQGGYDTEEVPPTVAALSAKNSAKDEKNYTWHVRVAQFKVGEVLRDEDYKGDLATAGETFKLVLARIEKSAIQGRAAFPSELTDMLPGRLRCVLKYNDFNKQWQVVALDVGPANSDKWASANVK